jgi:hypothetical protein
MHLDGRATYLRCAHNEIPLPPKVIAPALASRVKQLRYPAALRIEPREIRPFVEITELTLSIPANLTGIDPLLPVR